MKQNTQPQLLRIRLNSETFAELPLMKVRDDFSIYSFDMMGKCAWNIAAAETLHGLIDAAGVPFDILVTAEAKAIGLTEQLARIMGHDDYVVLRKSVKAYMKTPVTVDVKSITTESLQHFYLGEEKFPLLKGKRVGIIDDVVSTCGTLEAFRQLAGIIGFDIAFAACVLTEGERRTFYHDISILSIDHIPLPK